MLEQFNAIQVDSPVDKIISQIRHLITTGQFTAGDRLPPERKLAEKFGVGRSVVRDAIRKLEFYGIVKTLPQSGTVIEGLGLVALEGLISDVLNIEEIDFVSLVETRVLLEANAARMAALRRTDDDIISLNQALRSFEKKIESGKPAVEEDLLFHIQIAEASGNAVLKSLMLIITPDILKSFTQLNVCKDNLPSKAIIEHREILNHIINQDAEAAEKSMLDHLKEIVELSKRRIKR